MCIILKQKAAYAMGMSDCRSDVCSSDLSSRYRIGPVTVGLRRGAGRLGWLHTAFSRCLDSVRAGHFQLRRCHIARSVARFKSGEMGRASCWERVGRYVLIQVAADSLKTTTT